MLPQTPVQGNGNTGHILGGRNDYSTEDEVRNGRAAHLELRLVQSASAGVPQLPVAQENSGGNATTRTVTTKSESVSKMVALDIKAGSVDADATQPEDLPPMETGQSTPSEASSIEDGNVAVKKLEIQVTCPPKAKTARPKRKQHQLLPVEHPPWKIRCCVQMKLAIAASLEDQVKNAGKAETQATANRNERKKLQNPY